MNGVTQPQTSGARATTTSPVTANLTLGSTARGDLSSDPRQVPLLLTATQAAALLAISRTQVYALMGAGALPYVLIGRSRRIPRASLQEFVQDQLARRGFTL